MMVRGTAVEAAKAEDEIERINERRAGRWHVFAAIPSTASAGPSFYGTRLGKVSPAVTKHADFAMTVHAAKLDELEALMDEQDKIGWLRLWMTAATGRPSALAPTPTRRMTTGAGARGAVRITAGRRCTTGCVTTTSPRGLR